MTVTTFSFTYSGGLMPNGAFAVVIPANSRALLPGVIEG